MITPNTETYESGFSSETKFDALKTLARKELNAILDTLPEEVPERDVYSLLGLANIATNRGNEGWVPTSDDNVVLYFDRWPQFDKGTFTKVKAISKLIDGIDYPNKHKWTWNDNAHRARVHEMSVYHVRQLRNIFEDIYAALNEIQCLLQEVSLEYFEEIFEDLEPEFINLVKEIDELGVYGFMCRNEFTDQLNAGILNTLDRMKVDGLEISYPDFSEPDTEK